MLTVQDGVQQPALPSIASCSHQSVVRCFSYIATQALVWTTAVTMLQSHSWSREIKTWSIRRCEKISTGRKKPGDWRSSKEGNGLRRRRSCWATTWFPVGRPCRWAECIKPMLPGSSFPCWLWGSGGPLWAGLGAPLGPLSARCRRCDARSSPCRPSWWRYRARWGTSGSGFPFCSVPHHRRSCLSGPFQPSHPGKQRRECEYLQNCMLVKVLDLYCVWGGSCVPDAWDVQQWRGTRRGERRLLQSQLCTYRSHCPRRGRRFLLPFSG